MLLKGTSIVKYRIMFLFSTYYVWKVLDVSGKIKLRLVGVGTDTFWVQFSSRMSASFKHCSAFPCCVFRAFLHQLSSCLLVTFAVLNPNWRWDSSYEQLSQSRALSVTAVPGLAGLWCLGCSIPPTPLRVVNGPLH